MIFRETIVNLIGGWDSIINKLTEMINQNSEILNKLFFAELQILVEMLLQFQERSEETLLMESI